MRQFAPHDGDRYIVQHFEPQDRNHSTLGLDIASEPNRRLAADHAMRSGKATLTAPVSVLGATDEPIAAFMLLLPVYTKGLPLDTSEQRAQASAGWCYYTLVIGGVLKGIDLNSSEMALRLTDVTEANTPVQIYSAGDFNTPGENYISSAVRKTIFEREWLIETRAKPQFLADNKLEPHQAAMGIAALFALLAGLTYFVLRNREKHAKASIAQSHLAAIIESSGDAIIGADLDGRVSSWNNAAETIFGYAEKDALGRNLIELIVPEELAQEDRDFFARISRGELVPHFSTVRRTRLGEK